MSGRIAPSYGSDIMFASLLEYVLVSAEPVELGIKPPCLFIDGIHAWGLEPKHRPATLFPFPEHTRVLITVMTTFHLLSFRLKVQTRHKTSDPIMQYELEAYNLKRQRCLP